ncbi:hypothetical protein Ddye_015047 [Dipteronia dyeriana]|uniref:Ankyrin repeat domain-containing protein EMB506, chloroplastic n=1 Tax=Dipteronia dyeriana TaxID=168575 RepID=A0AAD9U4W0_9ROSI|nr:hypothetical protein Ddye_015047 [Dipteronia dyeriana]
MATFDVKSYLVHGFSTVVAVAVPAPSLSFFCTNFCDVVGNSRGRSVGLSMSDKHLKVRTCAVVGSKQVGHLRTRLGNWEDPDDGSGSEYDDDDDDNDDVGEEYDEEVVENDLDFESDWEEERNGVEAVTSGDKSTTTNKYEEELLNEVEQLLGPEERAILRQNATPNLEKMSTAKWKPLQTLALSMQIPLMDKLIANGVDIDSVDKDGLTALHNAVIGKKEAVISHLLRKGANPHVKDRDGATLLHYAVQVGALQTVKLLIRYKVDVNVADNEGWTPLHIAIQSRNRDISKVLIINGADKTRKNKDGKTALDLSLCYGKDFKSYDLAKLLKILPIE